MASLTAFYRNYFSLCVKCVLYFVQFVTKSGIYRHMSVNHPNTVGYKIPNVIVSGTLSLYHLSIRSYIDIHVYLFTSNPFQTQSLQQNCPPQINICKSNENLCYLILQSVHINFKRTEIICFVKTLIVHVTRTRVVFRR
jgi:hypothetical protein